MYLVKINKEQQLYGGIMVDVDSIVKMYKNHSLEKYSLNKFLKKINGLDLKRIEKDSKYTMKTVNLHSDRGNRNCDVYIDDVKHDVNMKISYELSFDEGCDMSDRYSLNITGFEIMSIPALKTSKIIGRKTTLK